MNVFNFYYVFEKNQGYNRETFGLMTRKNLKCDIKSFYENIGNL